jgi:large subunit ribosomal protein L25
MADRATLQAASRTVLGKQVSRLRREGLLPANVYGRAIDSLALQTDLREFSRLARAGALRGMFELRVDGEPSPRYVVLRGLTRKGGTGDPIHVDFYQVDLQRPIQTHVPLRMVGEPPAVRDLAGMLVQSLETVTVRCLPLAIPEAVDVDLSVLNSFSVSITVGDLSTPAGAEIVTDGAIVVASVSPPRIQKDAGE